MNRTSRMFVVAAVAAVLCAPVANSQEPSQVQDLTGQKLTAEQLIKALQPEEGPPPEVAQAVGARSLGPRPKCAHYRQQRSRGISVQPAVQPVAVEILFAFNSHEISPAAAANLDAIGSALNSSGLAACCFELEGHTDSIGSDGYNHELSKKRANSVVQYLVQNHGVAADRLMAIGYGESRPIAPNESDSGRQKNRRVQIVNLGYGTLE